MKFILISRFHQEVYYFIMKSNNGLLKAKTTQHCSYMSHAFCFSMAIEPLHMWTGSITLRSLQSAKIKTNAFHRQQTFVDILQPSQCMVYMFLTLHQSGQSVSWRTKLVLCHMIYTVLLCMECQYILLWHHPLQGVLSKETYAPT